MLPRVGRRFKLDSHRAATGATIQLALDHDAGTLHFGIDGAPDHHDSGAPADVSTSVPGLIRGFPLAAVRRGLLPQKPLPVATVEL